MKYNLKKYAATASVVAMMCGAVGTANAIEIDMVSPTGTTPANELAISAVTPFVDTYSFDVNADSGLTYPVGNVTFSITAPTNMSLDSLTAANLPGIAVSNITEIGALTAGQTWEVTVSGIDGTSTLSFVDVEMSIDNCGGSTGALTVSAEDDNGAGVGGAQSAAYPAPLSLDPQFVAPCVSGFDIDVQSDSGTDDTIIVGPTFTSLAPSNVIGTIQGLVNKDAVLDGSDSFITPACIDAVDFDVNLPGSTGITDVEIAIRLGVSAPVVGGVATFSLTDTLDITDLLNPLPDPIEVVTDGSVIAATSPTVSNVNITFDPGCGLIPSEAGAGGALDVISNPGLLTFGVFDWNGQANTISVYRFTGLMGATPFDVELSNSDANGVYSGTLIPDASGEAVINSVSFGLGAAAPTYTRADAEFTLNTAAAVDVDRLMVTPDGGITAFADGANLEIFGGPNGDSDGGTE